MTITSKGLRSLRVLTGHSSKSVAMYFSQAADAIDELTRERDAWKQRANDADHNTQFVIDATASRVTALERERDEARALADALDLGKRAWERSSDEWKARWEEASARVAELELRLENATRTKDASFHTNVEFGQEVAELKRQLAILLPVVQAASTMPGNVEDLRVRKMAERALEAIERKEPGDGDR